MTNQTFLDLRREWTELRFSVCDDKSVEYVRGSPDRLANFKRIGEQLGQRMEVILGVYLQKHLDSIFHWIATREDGTEGICGRIGDAQNYLDLLRAMVEEGAE